MATAHLDLDRPRGFSELLKETGRLFVGRPLLFPGLTLLLTIPPSVLIDGIWAGTLRDESDAAFHWPSLAVWYFVLSPPFVALHVLILQRLGEGVAPAPWRAVREAAALAPIVVAAFALANVAVALGLALLVIPGIYVGALLAFSIDAAVVERVGPVDALRASARLVGRRWRRVLGNFVGAFLVVVALTIAGALVGIALEEAVGAPAYFVVVTLVANLMLSLGSLFEALFYFELRHRAATET